MRITGGLYKNKRIIVPKGGNDIRPTSDKMRQAIFNMMDHAAWGMDLQDAVMLDGFCGSGIMGMEALSRGASYVIFADKDRNSLTHIQSILRHDFALDAASYSIKSIDFAKKISLPKACDFVFLDPPYRQDLVIKALGALNDGACLNEGALCLCEAERRADILSDLPPCFVVEDERIYGDSKLVALRYHATVK